MDMKRSKVIIIFLFVAIGFVLSPGSTRAEDTGKPTDQKSSDLDSDTYKIGSGDVLSLITWKEPDFTLDAVVRIDGMITFPLLDDIQAAGRTPVDVKKDIEERLKEYIADPIVTVIVKDPFSQKIYILGEVMKTGEYPLLKELSVLQAFSLAGGFTEWASKNEIILLRREGGKAKIIRIKYKDITKGKKLELDMLLKANDTIIVP